MGQVRHECATTTHAVRAAIQRSQASLATLSRELGINLKTVAKWRKRATVEDLKTGPKAPFNHLVRGRGGNGRGVPAAHAIALDDCLYALQPSIPHLTWSALHRCLQRHSISRLPDIEGDKPKRQRFTRCPIGFFHIDIAEVQTAEGKLYLFVGIDRTSKFAVTQLVDKADRRTAWEFLEHRLTKPNHPWTNGQVERMNRTIKEATVKRFHYESHNQLRTHLADFMAAYNFARRLKTLSGLTPTNTSPRSGRRNQTGSSFIRIHQMPGLNTSDFMASGRRSQSEFPMI